MEICVKYSESKMCWDFFEGEYIWLFPGGDERLIVIGGFGKQQIPLSEVEEFNPKTSQWDQIASK